MMSMTTSPATQAVLCPEYVYPCRNMSPGVSKNGAATRGLATTPPRGA